MDRAGDDFQQQTKYSRDKLGGGGLDWTTLRKVSFTYRWWVRFNR